MYKIKIANRFGSNIDGGARFKTKGQAQKVVNANKKSDKEYNNKEFIKMIHNVGIPMKITNKYSIVKVKSK